MKKLIALLSILLLPSLALASFSDVSSRHENRDAIEYVQDQGIVKGYSDGTYQPGRTINRAEFTKIIIEAQYEPEDWSNCPSTTFRDVNESDWFAPYVCLAVEEGIIKGYSDNTFRPSQNISFVEAAKIIVVAMGYNVSSDSTVWYRPYVRAMGDRAAIPSSVRDFSHSVTRGEMAEMIYRLKRAIRNKNSRSYEEMSGEGASASSANAEVGTGVFVNGTELSADVLASIAADHGGVQALPGNYWYDSTSGLYGNVGGPAIGQMLPGYNLGTLSRNASNGSTGIIINGRNIPESEKRTLEAWLGAALPGDYWLDAWGNAGFVGNPIPFVNLFQAAQASGGSGGGGGDNFWSSGVYSAGNYDNGNSRGYVSVPGVGPVGYGFD